jgi:hypothetical protein
MPCFSYRQIREDVEGEKETSCFWEESRGSLTGNTSEKGKDERLMGKY